MIGSPDNATWQRAMKFAIRDSLRLCQALGIDPNELPVSESGERQFPVFVPLEFLARMKHGDPFDPLLLQVIPRSGENIVSPDFTSDPVGDNIVEMAPGLLHKYIGRVLLIVSGACAVHCRYCFRRHYPYSTAPKSIDHWLPALEYIRSDASIHEVILSGGDPLTVADPQLSQLVELLGDIPHLTRLRIHTRVPVVIPQRVDANLCAWLERSRLAKWVVLHINHAQEIDSSVVAAIHRLKATGTTVLNQSVLLRDVNDNIKTLQELCEQLVDIGVMPYYLHQLDRVDGASHFESDPILGLSLVEELAKRLPGYAVPRYVSEIAGEPNKTPVALSALSHLP